MKKLLLLTLLAGCTNAPTEDPAHKAVGQYLTKTMDDPSSYQPVSWGSAKPYTKQEADHAKGLEKLHAAARLAKEAADYQALVYKLSGNQLPEARQQAAKWQREADRYSKARDSVYQLAPPLSNSVDTSRLGVVLTHAYRAKNKTAALVLDSARFVVLTNGSVMMQAL